MTQEEFDNLPESVKDQVFFVYGRRKNFKQHKKQMNFYVICEKMIANNASMK